MPAIRTLLISLCFVLIQFGCNHPDEAELDNPHDPYSPRFTPLPPSLTTPTTIVGVGVALHWSPRSQFAKGYVIERKPGLSGTYHPIGVVPLSTTSFTDTTMTDADSLSYYRIGAVGGSNILSYSNEVTISLPFTPPSQLQVFSATPNALRIFWKDNSYYEEGFVVERAVGAGAFTEVAVSSANDTTFEDNSVTPDNVYSYRIKAFVRSHYTSYSATLKAGFLPEDISLLNEISAGATSVAFESNDLDVAVGLNYFVHSYQIISGRLLKLFYHRSPVISVAIDPTGTYVAGGGELNTYYWRLSDGLESPRLAVDLATCDLSFAPDASTLAGANPNGILVWQVATGQVLKSIVQDWTSSVEYSHNGNWIAGGTIGRVTVWRASDGAQQFTRVAGTSAFTSITFSPDDANLITGSADGIVRIWSTSDSTLLGSIDTHNPIKSIALSPDGHLLLTAGAADGSVSVWNIPDGSLYHTISAHTSVSNCVAFGPSGRIFASTGTDGRLKIWSFGKHWWHVP